MILPDKVYKVFKWICLTVVPALNILIASLASIYGWEWSNIAIGTIDAIAVFVGTVLGIGSIRYAKLNDSNEA